MKLNIIVLNYYVLMMTPSDTTRFGCSEIEYYRSESYVLMISTCTPVHGIFHPSRSCDAAVNDIVLLHDNVRPYGILSHTHLYIASSTLGSETQLLSDIV